MSLAMRPMRVPVDLDPPRSLCGAHIARPLLETVD